MWVKGLFEYQVTLSTTCVVIRSSQLHACCVHDTLYKLQRDASPSVHEDLTESLSYLVTFLAFLPEPCNQGTPPGADV